MTMDFEADANFPICLFAAFHIFGPSGKLMVELCLIGYLMGTCIAYFVVVGDLGPQIVSKLFGVEITESLRWDWRSPHTY